MGGIKGDCETAFKLTNPSVSKQEEMGPEKLSKMLVRVTQITMILCLVMSAFSLTRYMTMTEPKTTNDFCIVCSVLTTEHRRALQTFMVEKGGKCCLNPQNGEQMAYLVQDMINKTNKMEVYLQNRYLQNRQKEENTNIAALAAHKSFNYIGAHKFLLKHKRNPRVGNLPIFDRPSYALRIKTGRPYPGEYANQVLLTPDGIQITHPALYFVYMSMYFLPDSHLPCKDFKTQTFTGKVFRHRGGFILDTLLTIEHTCCPECKRERSSGYTGGVFYLDAGDEISVNVSSYDVISEDARVSFLGVSLLGNNNSDKTNSESEALS